MAGLTKLRSWGNKLMAAYGVLSGANVADNLFWMIKESMLYGTNDEKGPSEPGAWIVVGSSDSINSNMSGTDLLIEPGNIVQGAGNHSWIVLQQPEQGLSPGFLQVCFDWNSLNYSMTMAFSVSVGFSGGSISARPTATDEIIVLSSTQVFSNSASNGSCGVNCLKSSDGKSTRIIITRDSILETRALWMFEELGEVESYWTTKSVVYIAPCTHASIAGASNLFCYQIPGIEHKGRMTWASMSGYALSQLEAKSSLHRPDYGGGWSVFPCGYCIDTGTSKGKVGRFIDFWAAPYTMPTGEYLGAVSGGNFQIVNIGGLVFPWIGTPLALP